MTNASLLLVATCVFATTTSAALLSHPSLSVPSRLPLRAALKAKPTKGDENDCPPQSACSSDGLSRRSALSQATALASAALAGTTAAVVVAPSPASATITEDCTWPLWPALPVAPYSRRRTLRRRIGPKIWTFDQLIGIYYVHVPIRMTVIATESGGLFVYAPVAPTRECLNLLQPLIDEHGPVKFIVLPSVAVEHKVLAGPFARKFPEAEFYLTDRQYAFPVNLPDATLGIPPWAKPLPSSSEGAEDLYGGEFDHEVLTVKPGPGSMYQDAAFYHRPSKTLLLCDALFAATADPPPILTDEPEYLRALLFHARDYPTEMVTDTPEARRKGWRRIVLLFNFFFPTSSAKADLGLGPILKLRPYELGWGGWMPFEWKSTEAELEAFNAYSADGKPTMLPIIQIILSRGNSGEVTQRWVDKVKRWNFERVIPAHLNAPLDIGPEAFADTFAFIERGRNEVRFCDDDVGFLRAAEESFLSFSVYKSNLGVLRGQRCGSSH